MSAASPRTGSRRKKTALIALVIVVLAGGALAASELTNTTYIFHRKKVPSTIPVQPSTTKPKKKSSSAKSSPTSNSAQSTAPQDKVASSTGGNTGGTLVQPYGSFVSNHYPGQNGSNTQEQSVCNTTPGATCYIQFTNSSTGQTTKLPAHTTESDGSTLWIWDSGILSSGKWEIKAVASLNGQTKSATDSIKLDIP